MPTHLPRYTPKKNGHFLLMTFLLSLLSAAVLFVPFIIANGGVFYYYGDFNVQEIPFYQMIHGLVRDGEMGWNHLTDLGTDTLASYSFYLLGSPFFWMTIPFPNEIVPNLIGPLLILKFACAASAAYIFLQRYVQKKTMAVLGGLLYAFSGFSIYNVFFFHFHEPMIVFPLLLAALDAFLYEKRRGIFAVAVFAACIVNYYFFVGQALFLLMYYLMIMFTKTCKFRIKEFLLLAAEVIIGFCGTAFVLLPSVLGLMGNPRLDAMPNGWESLAYVKEQKYWLIVLSFLFPADLPAMPVFTPESNCKWASVAGWLPLFGVTGAIAYLQLKKRDWLKKLILLLILFAMIPVLNSMFQLMNSSIYYARWFYMLVLMFVLASVRAVEDKEADWNRAIIWSTGLTVGATLLIGVMPNKITDENGETTKINIGVQSAPEKFWLYALMAMMSILVFVLIYKKLWHKRGFATALISCTLGVALFSSLLIIGHGEYISGTTESIKQHIINARDEIEIDDLEEVRSDFFEGVDNTSMYWKVQSINCFQSSVSTSIMQFYDKMGITRDVASRPDYNAYGLRVLFSCKYFFDDILDSNDPELDECFEDGNGDPKMPGFEYLKTCNGFKIYENENYVPMGFSYDSYVTEEEFERVRTSNRTEAILNAMVLTRDQMIKYPEITGYFDKDYYLLYSSDPSAFKSEVDKYTYGKSALKQQAEDLKVNSCSSFSYTRDGFKAEYEGEKETLVFFSIPYSDGFTATVNGEEADVEKVNYGFMAVKVPKGKSEIVFHYETPGFKTGTLISLCAAGAYIIYIALVIMFRIRKNKPKASVEPENTD